MHNTRIVEAGEHTTSASMEIVTLAMKFVDPDPTLEFDEDHIAEIRHELEAELHQ